MMIVMLQIAAHKQGLSLKNTFTATAKVALNNSFGE
jgi:hypothetical protein